MESETVDASIVEEVVIGEDYFIDNDEIEKEEVTTEEEESLSISIDDSTAANDMV